MSIKIEISDETYEKIKEIVEQDSKTLEISSYNDMIGKSYFFRTVTYFSLGKVTKIVGSLLQLEKASWIPDTGRFMNFLKNGVLDTTEVEPVGIFYINITTCVDIFPWKHDLPTKQQ